MGRRNLGVVFFLLLLVPSPFLAQFTQRKILSGYIREEGSGHLVTGAHIQLQNSMGTPLSSIYSDGNGAYEFGDTGGGDCYLVVEHKGYETARDFIRPDGSGHMYKDVFLRPANREATPTAVNPISERQLSIPPKAREMFDKGIQLVVEKSDYRGAVAQFARAIAKFPTYYEAYAAMGLAQNKMGDAAAAETALRKSVALSAEKYPQGMIDLASMYNGQKRFPDAEPLLRKVIALDASSWRAQFELAVALAGQQHYTEAVPSAITARDLKPENPQVYLLLYNLHIRTDNFPAALLDTEAYLKLSPDGAAADRVRRMQEQVQKAVQNSGSAVPAPEPPPATTSSRSPEAAATTASAGNFTPADSSFSPVDASPATPSSSAASTAPSTSANPVVNPPVVQAIPQPPVQPQPPASTLSIEPAATPLPAPPAAAPADDLPDEEPVAPPPPHSVSPVAPKSVIPARVDELIPPVAVDVPCSLDTVLHGAGKRAEQLLATLQKFDAFERVEHYKLNAAGVPGAADVRSFEYVVSVSHDAHGGFSLQEYRNGGVGKPRDFPSGIQTANLTAHGLIFHPLLAKGFHFTCQGLGEWKERPAWLVEFVETAGNVDPFRSYNINGSRYAVQLTGRAWIDAKTFQVVRLESDLLKPVEKIRLTREHIAIEYASVQFRTGNQRLWLPQSADLYVEWEGRRFYRRHSFSNFKVFSTDSTQEIHGPKNSYCFTNTTGLLITGVLNATPVPGGAAQPVSITLSIPARGTVCKSIGTGKDLNIPLEAVASTTFTHDGPAGSVEADVYAANQRAVEIIPSQNLPANPNP